MGHYNYGGKSERVRFECARLVKSDCTVPEDVITGDIKEDNIRLLVLKTENPLFPTSGLLIENKNIFEETYSRKIFEINIIRKYCAKGDLVDKLQSQDLFAEYKASGAARVGIKARRVFSSILNNLLSCAFNVPEPREAKCCQGWFDKVMNPNDSSEKVNIEKITTIRNMHAILNGLKRIRCLVCHQETPGFDIPYSDLQVLERGDKIFFSDSNIAKQLTKSKVLGVSVRLDNNFSKANQCIDEAKFFKGVV